MSLFDSKEEDPLLQNDPFSSNPNDEREAADPESTTATEKASTEVDPLLSSDVPADGDSIFSDGEAQIVVRSEEGISSGELAGLNAALRNFSRQGLFHLLDELSTLYALLREGWILDRIEFRHPPSASLAFVLTEAEADD